MPDADPPNPDSTVWAGARNDRLCDRFESLLMAGQPVQVFDFLRGEGIDPAAAGPELLRDLSRLEAYYRPAEQTKVAEVPLPPADDDPPDVGPGTVVGGRYTLVEKVGSGGMGEVWMARQTAPLKRTVAVKVIKRGMDSKAVLARFDAERQALAVMNHENIARILDGGVHDGRPFFVMELVKGVPITQFCDARKLTPPQRLELFVPVCRAIQHAHQKGVIHRDIKPSNVLVALSDDRPVPKVIDFGIAKATGVSLTDITLVTGFGAVVGTPEYMSPEQAGFNQLDIDTRTDVYSLGVLLYELLTGTTPVDRKSLEQAALHEILRIVREVDAPRPSDKLSSSDALPTLAANRGTEPKRLTGLFRGELDWIVLKALEKDRGRRYESALAFAADVERHLANEVVDARPPTPGYRLRKFVRRNKGPVLAVAAVFVALLGGVVGTTLGLLEANHQRDEKEDARGKEVTQRVRADSEAAEARRSRDDARSQFSAAKMNLADAAWRDGDAITAKAHLDALIPKPGETDLRGWEWYEMARSRDAVPPLARPDYSLFDAPDAGIAFSPTGEYFVCTTHYDPDRKTLDICSTATRTVTRRAVGVATAPFLAAFGPDESVALLSESGLSLHGPDGRLRWSADLKADLEYTRHDTSPSYGLAFDAKGRWVAAGGRPVGSVTNGRVVVFDAASGTRRTVSVPPRYEGAKGWVTAMASLSDGRLVTGCEDGRTRVWPLDFSDPVFVEPLLPMRSNGVAAVGPTAGDGLAMVVPGYPVFRYVWSPRLEQAQSLPWGVGTDFSPAVYTVGPDARGVASRLATGSAFTGQLAYGPNRAVAPGCAEGVKGLAYSPCGRFLLILGSSGTLYFRSPRDGLAAGGAFVWGAGLAVHPDGTELAIGWHRSPDNFLAVFDTATLLPLGRVRLGNRPSPSCPPRFSARGLLGMADGDRVRVFDPRSGAERYAVPLVLPRAGTGGWAFTPDGGRLIGGVGADTVLFDAETGRESERVPPPALKEAEGYPHGRVVAAGAEWVARTAWQGTALVVQGASGATRLGGRDGPVIPNQGFFHTAETDPSGRWLAVANGKTVYIWDARDWGTVKKLGPHTRNVVALAFHPSGRRVAVATPAGVTIWDTDLGQQLRVLLSRQVWVDSLTFSPDGGALYGVQSGTGRLWVWDGRPAAPDPVEHEAKELVAVIRDAAGFMTELPPEFRDRLDKFPNVSDPVRRKALEIFDAYDARRKAFKGVPNPTAK